jgi:hypothetical protein
MAFVHPYGIIGFASHIEFTGIKKGHELKKQQCIQRRIIESLKHQGLRLGKILKNQ